MASLKRKLIALFFTLVIAAAAVSVTGCVKEEPAPNQPAPQKAPVEEL
jgi:hypothetical protein